ncbi:MAG: DUF1214 domain-containing protein [Devosia sp.]|uniref:DUF1214 domain-containing protein n=1 Tax=Devosia sp. TaxID=1871048 RepID=UPI0019F2162A|nr:DUF1214 domain-containing protein [Devosia sp.]MBF0680901.1 DUF1214 domain-containing protein [Devosia sp.]
MRFVLRLLLTIAVALGIGFGLSHFALTDGRFFGGNSIGPWVAWPDAGTPQPNPYTRAHLVREAALQMGRAEGLQFIATTDSEGRPLDRVCSYRLVGHVPVSSFWTLVAIDENWINLAAPDAEPAMRSSEVVRDNNGAINVAVSTTLESGTWLEITGEGPFSLALSLYDTTAFSGLGAGNDTMPVILRRACR